MPNHGVICTVFACIHYNTNMEFQFHRFPNIKLKLFIYIYILLLILHTYILFTAYIIKIISE